MNFIKTNYFFGIVFLILQMCLITYARFVPERFFCWAPYDEHTYFEIQVEIDKKKLTHKEIKERYHYESIGWEVRAINNVFNMISQYENTYGLNENAEVLVLYSVNGHKPQTWYLKE